MCLAQTPAMKGINTAEVLQRINGPDNVNLAQICIWMTLRKLSAPLRRWLRGSQTEQTTERQKSSTFRMSDLK